MKPYDLIIVGAGPYGLAAGAEAKRQGLNYLILGQPMAFWRQGMPRGMFLRSGVDWHMDPSDEFTFLRYLESRGFDPTDVSPVPLSMYLNYSDWFIESLELNILEQNLVKLDRQGEGFTLDLSNGQTLLARKVVATPGLKYFAHRPPNLVSLLGQTELYHSSEISDFSRFARQRVLIIGGRQSAFESAALLAEYGAKEIFLVYRHDTPRFEPSDWSFMDELESHVSRDPTWYRRLTNAQKEDFLNRAFEAGRARLEPWLDSRISKENIHRYCRDQVTSCLPGPNGNVVALESGKMITADVVILATGFKVDLNRVPYLSGSHMLAEIETDQGFPVLDDRMQSTSLGLFLAGMVATQRFGVAFGFLKGCRTAAKICLSGIVPTLGLRIAEQG